MISAGGIKAHSSLDRMFHFGVILVSELVAAKAGNLAETSFVFVWSLGWCGDMLWTLCGPDSWWWSRSVGDCVGDAMEVVWEGSEQCFRWSGLRCVLKGEWERSRRGERDLLGEGSVRDRSLRS